MRIYSYYPNVEQDPISKKVNQFSLKDEENPTKDNEDSKSYSEGVVMTQKNCSLFLWKIYFLHSTLICTN